MDRDRIFDVIVVGGGLAGLTAAARACEAGLSVVVVEQGKNERYPCNSRYSGGILHFAYHDVRSAPEVLVAAATKALGEDANPALIDAAAEATGRALDWLSRFDVRFVKSSPVSWHRWTLAPPRPLRPGLDFPGSGPDRLLALLGEAIKAGGDEIFHGLRAVDLAREGEHWMLVAEGDDGTRHFRARAAILADGGFQGDAELVRRHVSKRPDLIVQRGAGTGCGFAVRTAERLGCGLTRMDRFYGHVLSRNALDNPRLWPYPQLDPLATNGIVVGSDGRRFTDEGRGGVFIANELAKLSDPSGAWAILDEAIWESAGRQSLYPPNPHLVDAGGTLLRTATLGELAKACGLDASVLEKTVSEFNSAAGSGQAALAGLGIPRTQSATIIRAPFVAVPLVAGITNTMGGLMVDARARVLDTAGEPIGNLYAVGASAGGLEGGKYVGYVGGLVRALTSGLAAADDVAADRGKAARLPRSAARGSREAAPAPPRRPDPTVLRMLARHPVGISVAASIITFAIVLVLAWPVVAFMALLPAVAIGTVVFLLAKAFCELAAIILDVLVPG